MRRCAKDGYVGSKEICRCGSITEDYPNIIHIPYSNGCECTVCNRKYTHQVFGVWGPQCSCHLSLAAAPPPPPPAAPPPNVAGVQQALSTATNAAMLAHLVAVQPALTQNIASQMLDAYLAEVSREPKCECGAAAIGIKPGGAGHALDYCPVARKS